MITTSAASSRIDSAMSKAMNIPRQRRCVANHHAYSSGAITSASGWKFAQLIHWIGRVHQVDDGEDQAHPWLGEPVAGDQVDRESAAQREPDGLGDVQERRPGTEPVERARRPRRSG